MSKQKRTTTIYSPFYKSIAFYPNKRKIRPRHISPNDLSDIVQRTIDYFQIDSYIQIEIWDPYYETWTFSY